jgi:hypothetical protein
MILRLMGVIALVAVWLAAQRIVPDLGIAIFVERDRKLDPSRERRKAARATSRAGTATDPGPPIARPGGGP